MSEVATEFALPAPLRMSDLYSLDTGVPASGQIQASSMYGKRRKPILDFNASLLSGGSGTAVSTWPNVGTYGSSWNMTGYNVPIIDLMSTYKHVYFDGAVYFGRPSATDVSWLQKPELAGSTGTTFEGMTAFVVAKFTDAIDASTGNRLHMRLYSIGDVGGNIMYLARQTNATALTAFCRTTSGTTSSASVTSTKSTLDYVNFHIYVVRMTNGPSGGTLSLFVDSGSVNDSATFSSPFADYTTSNIYFGRSPPQITTDGVFDGLLRQVRIYDYALSDTDLASTYNSIKTAWGM